MHRPHALQSSLLMRNNFQKGMMSGLKMIAIRRGELKQGNDISKKTAFLYPQNTKKSEISCAQGVYSLGRWGQKEGKSKNFKLSR